MSTVKPANPTNPPPRPTSAQNGGAAAGNRPLPYPPSKAQPYRYPPRNPPPPRRRRRRHSICCLVTLWLSLLILAFVFFAAIAAGVFYLLYHPQRPNFTASNLRLQSLNLSTSDSLYSKLSLTLTARNPNHKIKFDYGDVSISAFASGVLIGQATVPGFVQNEMNTTVVRATVKSSWVALDPADAAALRKRKRYAVGIEMETMAGIRIGKFRSKRIGISARCDGIDVAVSKNSTAPATTGVGKCKVRLRIKIWNWTL